MSRLHRRSHDIYGNIMKFHTNNPITLDTTKAGDTELNLNFKFIQLNKKWRLNIDTDSLKIEKYNTETQTYDTKFNFT
jgi:alkyl sulfatase BDS1-like metallo-beta-lactamase superfamily hydrolase